MSRCGSSRRWITRAASVIALLLGMTAFLVYGLAAPAGASSVSGVSAPVLSTTAAGASAVEYNSIGFTVTTAMAATGTSVTIAAPAGTILSNGCDNIVHDDTTGQQVACGGLLSNANATLTLSFNNGQAVGANDHLTVTLRKVTNPAAGTYTLAVWAPGSRSLRASPAARPPPAVSRWSPIRRSPPPFPPAHRQVSLTSP
jgi:hypothetical protein